MWYIWPLESMSGDDYVQARCLFSLWVTLGTEAVRWFVSSTGTWGTNMANDTPTLKLTTSMVMWVANLGSGMVCGCWWCRALAWSGGWFQVLQCTLWPDVIDNSHKVTEGWLAWEALRLDCCYLQAGIDEIPRGWKVGRCLLAEGSNQACPQWRWALGCMRRPADRELLHQLSASPNNPGSTSTRL